MNLNNKHSVVVLNYIENHLNQSIASKYINKFSLDKVIDTKEYHDKFMKLDYSKIVNESLYKNSRIILNDRKDTSFETTMAIDSRTGKVIATSTTNEKFKSAFNNEQKEIINANSNSLIIIHNHPGGGRLSFADITLLFNEDNCSSMFAIGHNGDLCGIKKNVDIDLQNIEKQYKKYYTMNNRLYDKLFAKKRALDAIYEYLIEKGCVIYGNY
jgi:hypothetical protein